MVIKGRIHGELGKIERCSWNLVKSDDEMSLEIGHFDILRKITQNRIHGIKNQMIWWRIRREIENWRREKNSFRKTNLNRKLNEIKL